MRQIHLQIHPLHRIHRVRVRRCRAQFHPVNLSIRMEEALQNLTTVMTINIIEYVQNQIVRKEIVPDHNPNGPIHQVRFRITVPLKFFN